MAAGMAGAKGTGMAGAKGTGMADVKMGKRSNGMEMKYADGLISMTYVRDFGRAGYMTFDDLVKRDHLQKAFFCAFQVDDEWLMDKLPRDINICVARHRGSDIPADVSTVYMPVTPRLMWVFPPMAGTEFGCMHSKIMMLWYPGFLRVVITSANLFAFDWELLENVVFVQDFPELPTAIPEGSSLGRFGDDLLSVLREMKIPRQVGVAMRKFDFGRARGVLVASKPGSFTGDDLSRYGHTALARVVRTVMGVPAGGTASLFYQTSSLGSLTVKWMNEFHRSACGLEPEQAPTKPRGAKATAEPDPRPFYVLFPTEANVKSSRLGAEGGGTISFQRRYWNNGVFPRDAMRNLILAREGALAHAKVMFWIRGDEERATRVLEGLVRPGGQGQSLGAGNRKGKGKEVGSGGRRMTAVDDDETTDEEDGEDGPRVKGPKPIGWFYCGSHNSTQSAWGNVTKPRGKDWTIRMTNWELGVVVPVYESGTDGVPPPVPVPFKVPLTKYRKDDVPWCVGKGFGQGPPMTP
ncbi:hypothetical protein HK104_005185 [Borealophlyctis nickersoniae]|nr:hypothetical protein HK104_005185 [Borealophlyctis nickersoniae]